MSFSKIFEEGKNSIERISLEGINDRLKSNLYDAKMAEKNIFDSRNDFNSLKKQSDNFEDKVIKEENSKNSIVGKYKNIDGSLKNDAPHKSLINEIETAINEIERIVTVLKQKMKDEYPEEWKQANEPPASKAEIAKGKEILDPLNKEFKLYAKDMTTRTNDEGIQDILHYKNPLYADTNKLTTLQTKVNDFNEKIIRAQKTMQDIKGNDDLKKEIRKSIAAIKTDMKSVSTIINIEPPAVSAPAKNAPRKPAELPKSSPRITIPGESLFQSGSKSESPPLARSKKEPEPKSESKSSDSFKPGGKD